MEPSLETLYKERALREQGKEWLVASYKPEEFGVTNRDDINWMSTRLSPMPWHTHDQSIRILNPLAKTLPKSYIRGVKHYLKPLFRHVRRYAEPFISSDFIREKMIQDD